MLCNAHVRSQISESTKLLVSAHKIHGTPLTGIEGLPEPTHLHHPSTKWVAAHHSHYNWLWNHLSALLDEYKLRHGVPHYYCNYVEALAELPETLKHQARRGEWNGQKPPPAVVSADLKPKFDDEDITSEDVVAAYRRYYNRDKRHLHYWMVRAKPDWID